jgi:ribosome maturation factor RimP
MKPETKQLIENQIVEILSTEVDLFLVQVKIDAKNNVKVFLDGDNGISIGQCTSVNRSLYPFIEEAKFFPNDEFSLEVSSAGVDEPLLLSRQYNKNIGRDIEVLLKDGIKFIGKLVTANEKRIELERTEGKGKKAVTTTEELLVEQIKTAIVQIKF